jgi:LacI family transcriptional regulator
MSSTGGRLRIVAEKANVSVATVSYVLSGKGRMAVDTRRRIEQLLRETGLRPRWKRYPVFFICDRSQFSDSHHSTPFIELYEGMNRALHESEVHLRVEFLNSSSGVPLESQLEQLMSYKPGAVALDSNLNEKLAPCAEFFEAGGVPVVQVGHTVRAAAVDAVVVDNFGGAHSATRHLISAGHTRIATIRWNEDKDPASAKKHAGFVCAMGEAGLPVRPEYVISSPYTNVAGKLAGRTAATLLSALPEPPTAVFVENSFISPSLLYPSYPGETAIPQEIARLDFVHFEAWHLEWVEQVMAGKLAFPGRKTKLMRINWQSLGQMTAQRVVARMEGAPASGDVVQIVPRLFEVDGYQCKPI